MIELLFVACLSASPTDCEERSLIFTDVTPRQCLMGAQPELAKWVSTHPQWQITRWRCQNLQTAEKDA